MMTQITPSDMTPLDIFVLLERYNAPIIGKHGKAKKPDAEVRITYEKKYDHWRLRIRDTIWDTIDDYYVSNSNDYTNDYLRLSKTQWYYPVSDQLTYTVRLFPEIVTLFRLHELLIGHGARCAARDRVDSVKARAFPYSLSLAANSSQQFYKRMVYEAHRAVL